MNLDIIRVQILGCVSSILLFSVILGLMRKNLLKASHSLIWMFLSFVLFIFSVWREAMHYISSLIGIAYPPAMLFILLILGLVLVILQLFVIVTKLSISVKKLIQEIGLLKFDLDNVGKPQNGTRTESSEFDEVSS